MGLKYNRNTSGWTPSKDDDFNNDDPWTAEIQVPKQSKKKKEGQTDGKVKTQTLEISASTERADFYISEPGAERSFLRYNGRTDEVVIIDEEKFEEYFAGSRRKEQRFEKIKRNTLKDILSIAEYEVVKAETRQRTGDYPRRDAKRLRRLLEKVEAKPGIKSLFNTAEPKEISEATSNDKSKKDKGPNTPKDGKVSANVDVEVSINSSSSGFVGPVQNGSGSRIDIQSDIAQSSIVSLEMPVETPPAATFKQEEKLMRYPVKVPPFGYDHIEIKAHNYKAGGLVNSFNLPGADIGGDKRKTKNNKPIKLGTVILPMQPNLSETNSIDWGGDKLNPIRAAMAGVAGETIDRLSDADFGGAAAKLFGGTAETIKALTETDRKAVIAYFAGQAVGANVQARSTGQVINPNLELLFSGPRLRTFNFNFTLTPRSDEEALEVRRIIRFFKRTSAPSISSNGLFLQTPSIYTLRYIFDDKKQDKDGQHPFLNKFKPCAMTSFNINYTPDGSYSTYHGGSMTSYALSMTFGELQPIYAGDNVDDTNDMGF